MNWKRHLLETVTLVAVAVACASISNLIAARERRLAFVGSYPDALKVPAAAAPDAGPAAGPEPRPSTPAVPSGAAAPAAPAMSPPTPDAGPRVAERPTPVVRPRASEPARQEEPAASSAAPASSAAAPRVTGTDLLSRFPPHKDKPWVEVSGDGVSYLHSAGALFIDARRTSVYEEGHVAGARSMPVWEADVDERVTSLVGEGRDTAQPVVLYCSGGDCEDSHMLAQKLWGAGFENLLVYRDGFPDWQKRGGAIHRGPRP